ncbi:MAG: transglutaminase family protein [Kovacikia sp.]
MRYQISHTTTYNYSRPVTLLPHVIRLRPRSDSCQTLRSFSLLVSPTPQQESQIVDLEGSGTVKVWFKQEQTDSLRVQVISQVETHCINPFNYLLEPWAVTLPIDYPSSLSVHLQPYLVGPRSGYAAAIDPIALQLAQELHHQVDGNVTSFLSELTQKIYKGCQQVIRETGEPFSPGITWTKRSGSCRDLTVLFMEVCRAIGLPSRFVSGYQEGDPGSTDLHLHAWAEVYLPGAGWRGFDPSHGTAVADRHIALVSSIFPAYAAPISGSFSQGSGAQAEMTYQLLIQGF